MAKPWIDQPSLKATLSAFFQEHKSSVTHFGSTVNQCFEAYVFSSMVTWYKEQGWEIEFVHPEGSPNVAKLKFNTRGRPDNYTYAVCTKSSQRIQVRHSLRVATRHFKGSQRYDANVVLDVAVIEDGNLSHYGTNDALDNEKLLTFAEAKHMSAFAELVAGFIGLVHEICPDKLKRRKTKTPQSCEHLPPYLFVSGHLLPTAMGIVETMTSRKMQIRVYDYTQKLTKLKLNVKLIKDSKPKKGQSVAIV